MDLRRRRGSPVPVRSPQAIWETALGQLELQVTRPNYETWLRNTIGVRLEADELIVGVPSDFASEWLRSRLSGLVGRTVSQLIGHTIGVSFEVLGAAVPPASPETNGERPAPAPERAPPNLDPRLTFASFTVVKSNRFACRAAARVAAASSAYNPLVLVGPPGLGKTHLLHAIGHECLAAGKRVVALTSEAFVNEYGSAARQGHPHTFRDLFQGCDVFLLDDLSFLATRAASQEQFFHIFNILQSVGAALVVTCETHPESISGLSSRLRSRLQGGLITELHPPSPAERLELLRALAEGLSQPLPDAVLRFIADRPSTSVRDLAGALHRVAAYSDFSDRPLSIENAAHALHPFAADEEPSAQLILDTVCRHFHLSVDQLKSPSRAREITFARHIAMYLLRNHSPRALADIGQLLGGRDHSTVLTAYRRITRERASLPQTREHLSQIEAALRRDNVA